MQFSEFGDLAECLLHHGILPLNGSELEPFLHTRERKFNVMLGAVAAFRQFKLDFSQFVL